MTFYERINIEDVSSSRVLLGVRFDASVGHESMHGALGTVDRLENLV